MLYDGFDNFLSGHDVHSVLMCSVDNCLYFKCLQIPHRFFSSKEFEGNAKADVKEARDPKDRSIKIPVETSIRYLKSRGKFDKALITDCNFQALGISMTFPNALN